MDFVSIRIITADVARLVEFYERVTGLQAAWATEDFAELYTRNATLAIGSTRTVAPGSAFPADNRSAIIEFLVDDVDRVYEDLTGYVTDFVAKPTTMPWAIAHCCSATPTATSSTSSRLSAMPPAPSSHGQETEARWSVRRTSGRAAR